MNTISRTTSFRLDDRGTGTATFSYNPADPYAVRLDFDGVHAWTVSRELLIAAFKAPSGTGDIRCRRDGRWFLVALTGSDIDNLGGEEITVTLWFVTAQVRRFLDDTRRLVPYGREQLEPEIGYDAEWELSLLGGER